MNSETESNFNSPSPFRERVGVRVITQPYFFPGEAERITLMFQSGLQCLHLRKPGSSEEECHRLVDAIPACYHSRIVRHTSATSCHSLAEVIEKKRQGFDFMTLSPIFDSISKQGYKSAFSREELLAAKAEGIIDERVFALGGICRDNIDEALSYGFGGVMVLGDAWHAQQPPIVLSIAGSDPSAGAGIQQDLKTITNCGCYGATVVTALTAQNTLGVQDVMPVPPEVVESQLRSIFDDLRVDAVKIGMIPNTEVARVVINVLKDERRKRILPIVCDPVMLSTSGHRLMAEDCIALVARELFPICTLVTPNIPEMQYLDTLRPVLCHTMTEPTIPTNTLLKGGHAESNIATDVLYLRDEDKTIEYQTERIETNNLHGTGCTLSSAIAAHLAQGHSLASAIHSAKSYVTRSIKGGKDLHIGHGAGPLWWNSQL